MPTAILPPESSRLQNASCFSPTNMAKLKQVMYANKFSATSTIFHEGDRANHLYYLQSGMVKLTKLSEEGKEYIMSLFRAGDFFGQIDPFQHSRHGFTALALEECEIGVIQKSDLEVVLWQNGDLAVEFMNWMGYMQRLMQTKFRDLLMYGKPGALCSTLIRFANTFGKPVEQGIRIGMKLTNSELADYIGCARESVNRMLAELKRAGAVSVNDGIITITNLKHLQGICKCESCPIELCRI